MSRCSAIAGEEQTLQIIKFNLSSGIDFFLGKHPDISTLSSFLLHGGKGFLCHAL
jgi:hypothetical protein